MLGYDPARVEVLLYQLVHLTREGEATKMSKRRGDVVRSTSCWTRSASTPPAGSSSTAVTTRRSRSTSTWPASGPRRTPSTTSSTRTRRIAGILRNAEAARRRRRRPRALARGARARQAARRVPGVVAEATERRGPHAIPVYAVGLPTTTTASTTTTACSGASAEGFRLGLCRATQLVIARCLDLVGVEAPERM